jgi:hypothetical protein
MINHNQKHIPGKKEKNKSLVQFKKKKKIENTQITQTYCDLIRSYLLCSQSTVFFNNIRLPNKTATLQPLICIDNKLNSICYCDIKSWKMFFSFLIPAEKKNNFTFYITNICFVLDISHLLFI